MRNLKILISGCLYLRYSLVRRESISQQLTSWPLLYKALLDVLSNPVAIIAVITAFLGIWNDNSTKGLDKIQTKKVNTKGMM